MAELLVLRSATDRRASERTKRQTAEAIARVLEAAELIRRMNRIYEERRKGMA